MPTIRRVLPSDLLHLNQCNLDPYTENYDLNFYLTYLMRWPSLFQCIVEDDDSCSHQAGQTGRIVAYIMGKLESTPPSQGKSSLIERLPWHGHITILTVSPTHRRHGYARLLTQALEAACEGAEAYFVDLYVRESNVAAIDMYKEMGYLVYRRVVGYYSDDVDGSENEEEEEEEEEEGGELGQEEREKKKKKKKKQEGMVGGKGERKRRGKGKGKIKGRGEDAFDMRKPLGRDAKERKYVREKGGEEVRVGPDEVF